MRILLWHGYLLGGTGSNVYTRQLAREWSNAGHEVTVLCQEPHPERYDLGGAEVLKPDVGGLLPVFVLDRYEGYEVKLLQDCSRAELADWVEANAAVLRERLPADLVFCNHVLLGGAVGAATGAPYAVKAHGSELEYSMRGRPELEAWGRDVLAGAGAVFVGSAHIREVLEEVCRPRRPRARGPAGCRRRRVAAARSGGRAGRAPRRGPARPPESRQRERAATRRGKRGAAPGVPRTDDPTIVYFGKLLYNKGVHLLLEALRGIDARAVVVGFGDYREELERGADPERTLFTGPLEHRHLVHLLALADACVVPSIFPEAFGMVAAEAAAAGCPSARRPPLRTRRDRGRAGGVVSARAPEVRGVRDR